MPDASKQVAPKHKPTTSEPDFCVHEIVEFEQVPGQKLHGVMRPEILNGGSQTARSQHGVFATKNCPLMSVVHIVSERLSKQRSTGDCTQQPNTGAGVGAGV